MQLNSIEELIEDIRQGKMVILMDDEDRENEGDLVMAAEHVTPEAINFMARFGRGLICMPMSKERCEQLDLPLMVRANGSGFGTKFTVSIEAREGVTTGISAADRARTVQAAAAKHAKASDIVQPGHIFPLMAEPGGVLRRAGHTEAACDLAALAGFDPSGVICEIMNDDGTMARGKQLINFARKHKLKLGKIDDLIAYRLSREKLIKFKKSSLIRIKKQNYNIKIFENLLDGSENFALIKGNIKRNKNPRVRVISSNIVKNYLMGEKLPNSFNKTIEHFKNHISSINGHCSSFQLILVFLKRNNNKQL